MFGRRGCSGSEWVSGRLVREPEACPVELRVREGQLETSVQAWLAEFVPHGVAQCAQDGAVGLDGVRQFRGAGRGAGADGVAERLRPSAGEFAARPQRARSAGKVDRTSP